MEEDASGNLSEALVNSMPKVCTVFRVSFVAAVFSSVTLLYLLLCVCGFCVVDYYLPVFSASCSVFGSLFRTTIKLQLVLFVTEYPVTPLNHLQMV